MVEREPYAESEMTGVFPERCEICGENDIDPSVESFELTGKLLCEDCAEAEFEKEVDDNG
jgi:formylmethanofuran dehydrogenase subunit E